MNYKDIQSQLDTFLHIIKQNTDLMDVLEYIETMHLPNYCTAAGAIFQTVWNYYDKTDLINASEQEIENRVTSFL